MRIAKLLQEVRSLVEAPVTAAYITKDVNQALADAGIPGADLNVSQQGDAISVKMRCRKPDNLKKAGEAVIKHLESEQVPTEKPTFDEVADGVWEFAFVARAVEPSH